MVSQILPHVSRDRTCDQNCEENAGLVADKQANLAGHVAGLAASAGNFSQVSSQVPGQRRAAGHRQRPRVLQESPHEQELIESFAIQTSQVLQGIRGASFLLAKKAARTILQNMRQILRLSVKHATILAASVASFAQSFVEIWQFLRRNLQSLIVVIQCTIFLRLAPGWS